MVVNMKLVVGSRGNFESTKAIIEGTSGRISEIYVSIENSRFGSGRNYVHEINISEIARQVKFAEKFNIDISLAFNTVCFGLEKFKKSFQDELVRMAENLYNSGVHHIIISDPFIMEIIKEKVPQLKIIVSVFAEVDSLNRLEFYNKLGVDRIIIPHELNRNTENLKTFVEKSRCDLEVILNLACYHYCARGDCHSMYTGHYTGDMRSKTFGDYYTSWCYRHKVNSPGGFLSQDWIRPEDVHRYEEMGIKYFKIAGRATATSWIKRTANAYLDRSYDGNLCDLITSYYPFTDRFEADVKPFSFPNKNLDEIMDILYSCGHHCEGCRRCGALEKDMAEGR